MAVCTICAQPEGMHNGTSIRHTFTPPGVDVDTSQFARKRPKVADEGDDTPDVDSAPVTRVQTPMDPVLRTALIERGVISIEDLEAAERKVHALTGEIHAIADEAARRAR